MQVPNLAVATYSHAALRAVVGAGLWTLVCIVVYNFRFFPGSGVAMKPKMRVIGKSLLYGLAGYALAIMLYLLIWSTAEAILCNLWHSCAASSVG